MIEQLFKLTMIAGIITGFAIITYTNLSPKRKDKSIIYLNFFVFFFTLNNLQITLADYNFIDLNFFERKLLIPFYALIIPAFYTFVTYYLKAQNKVKSFVIISIILFTLEIIMRFVLYLYFYNNSYIVAQYAKYEEIINLSYTISLFLKVVYIFMSQSKYYEEIALYDNMQWLKKFLIFGFSIIIFWVVAVASNFKEVLTPNIPIYYPLRFSSTLLVFWIAYYGFFKYKLLTERIELRKIISNEKPKNMSKTKYTDNLFEKIETHIVESQKYLNPKFSVQQLEKDLNINHRKIAEAIKLNTNQNFTDYITELRIKKSMQLLKDKEYSEYTIIGIGLECGFNSKSSFYREFYEIAKTTPSEYRNLA